MSCFTEISVRELYDRHLEIAKASLSELDIFCRTRDPAFHGLTGWVFEQAIQFCLRKELEDQGIQAEFHEASSLGGRVKTDLVIAKDGMKIAIEIKACGIFGMDDVVRYGRYSQVATERGLLYLFVTKEESHLPYRTGIQEVLGIDNAFFLDTLGDWSRFVTRIASELQKVKPAT